MYTKDNTNNWQTMPGPGDPETWGPCTNHPNDPRTPDAAYSEDALHDARIEMAINRVGKDGMDWVFEAFSEAKTSVMREIWNTFLEGNTQRLGELVEQCLEDYVLPSDWEAAQWLSESEDDGV